MKAAAQRLTAAEALLRVRLTLDAQYLAGYTIECSLKSLIMHLTPDDAKLNTLQKITRSATMHLPDTLFGLLHNLGVSRPLELTIRLRRVGWSTELRCEVGRLDFGETRAFLNTAKAIYTWVEDQLP